MRSIAAAAAATAVAALLAAPAVAAQYPELCDLGPDRITSPGEREHAQTFWRRVPSPRWLVVTVIQRWSRTPDGPAHWAAGTDGWFPTLHAPGQTILDRCRIAEIEPAGENAAARFNVEPGTTTIVLAGENAILTVTESPKSICAALDDCAVPLPDEAP